MFDMVRHIDVKCVKTDDDDGDFDLGDSPSLTRMTPRTEIRMDGVFMQMWVVAPQGQERAKVVIGYTCGRSFLWFDILCLWDKAGLVLRDQHDIGDYLFPDHYNRDDPNAEIWICMTEAEVYRHFHGYCISRNGHEELFFPDR